MIRRVPWCKDGAWVYTRHVTQGLSNSKKASNLRPPPAQPGAPVSAAASEEVPELGASDAGFFGFVAGFVLLLCVGCVIYTRREDLSERFFSFASSIRQGCFDPFVSRPSKNYRMFGGVELEDF